MAIRVLSILFFSMFFFFSVEAKDKSSGASEEKIFIPDSECYPDPVLDSIIIEGRNVYVEDHLITSGEMSYLMRKVNAPLYEKLQNGQKMYFIGALSTFVGGGLTCTGYFWYDTYTGSRKTAGKALLIAGVPIAAAGLSVFTVGVVKASSAKREFKRDCLGVASLDLSVGVGSLGAKLVF